MARPTTSSGALPVTPSLFADLDDTDPPEGAVEEEDEPPSPEVSRSRPRSRTPVQRLSDLQPPDAAKCRTFRVTSGTFASRQIPACMASRTSICAPADRSSRNTAPAHRAAPRVSIRQGAASRACTGAGSRTSAASQRELERRHCGNSNASEAPSRRTRSSPGPRASQVVDQDVGVEKLGRLPR